MRHFIFVLAVAGIAGCAAFDRDIDDGGRAARDLENSPVAGPASNETRLAQPWSFADGPLPSFGGRSAGEEAAAAVCDAERWSTLTGATESDLQSTRLPENFRIICFECSYTEDHVPSRVNFFLSRTGRVERVTCG